MDISLHTDKNKCSDLPCIPHSVRHLRLRLKVHWSWWAVMSLILDFPLGYTIGKFGIFEQKKHCISILFLHLLQQSIFPTTPLMYNISFYHLLLSGFVSHQAIARTAGNVLIRLADSLVLPLNCSDYAESLEDYLNTAVTLYEQQLQAKDISMGKHRTVRGLSVMQGDIAAHKTH